MKKDKELYKLYLNGDKEAFNDLIIMYRQQLEKFIYTYVKDYDIAEDIFQDVFIYLLVNPKNYRFKYEFKTYLYTIARSRSLNYLKSNRINYNIDDLKNEIIDSNEVESIIIKNESIIIRKNIIKELSRDQQIIIELMEEGFNYNEISKIVNKSIPSIKMIIYRLKKKLNKQIRKEDLGDEN